MRIRDYILAGVIIISLAVVGTIFETALDIVLRDRSTHAADTCDIYSMANNMLYRTCQLSQ